VNLTRRLAVLAPGLALALGAASLLAAHDFWLVPNAFHGPAGAWIEVRGQTSSRFPTSESAVAAARVAEARVLGADSDAVVTDLSVSGPSLLIRHRPAAPGQRVVAVTLRPIAVRASAAGFREYLLAEGAPEALERYAREGRLPTDSITRRYAKYAKTLVEVGEGGPRAFSRVAGHPAEFVPLMDPGTIGPGDTLPVRLLFLGSPLPRATVHAGSVEDPSGAERATTLETDADGVVRIPIDRAGLWNVRAIHVVPVEGDPSVDWDTHWVTLVFGVDAAPGGAVARPAGSAATDSAEVAAVVHRFHAALEAADSLAALALLTEDATILENGGAETKEEYRSHHLPGDIAFARAVRRDAAPVRVVVRGDVAWTSSISTARGSYGGREVNSRGAELMVLVRTPAGWRISAIHWSSRALRT
jgi:ketosteroid isomerase-like protein